MGEPNVTAVPGIILRTIARTLARVLFLVAGALVLAGLALTLVSLLLCTWRTARPRRVQLLATILEASIQLAKTFRS